MVLGTFTVVPGKLPGGIFKQAFDGRLIQILVAQVVTGKIVVVGYLVVGVVHGHGLVGRAQATLEILPEPLDRLLHGLFSTVPVNGLLGYEETIRPQPSLDEVFAIINEAEVVFIRNTQGDFISQEVVDFHHIGISFRALLD